MKTKLIVLLFILINIIIVGLYVYKQITKTNESLTSVATDLSVSANKMIDDFSTDEKIASLNYVNKIVETEGVLKNIENDRSPATLVIGDSSSTINLRFTLDSSFQFDRTTLQVGTRLTMKGMCTGYNADDLGLGADILFNRSIIINQNKN